jgi:quinol monooxygenase YgiN
MSIVVRFPLSNMTRQQYDSVRNALTESSDWPAHGCQLHVLFGDENDLRVSEVWESREKFDAFGQTLGPRIEEAGMQLSGEPEVFEAHIFETF